MYQEFFAKHSLENVFEQMDQYLLEHQPEDPLDGMSKFLDSLHQSSKIELPEKKEKDKTLQRRVLLPEEVLEFREVFNEYDKDGNGSIDRKEMEEMSHKLGAKLSGEELDSAMQSLDGDEDGVISFDEFLDWWTSDKKLGGVGGLKLKVLKAKMKLSAVEKKLGAPHHAVKRERGKSITLKPQSAPSPSSDSNFACVNFDVVVGNAPQNPKTSFRIHVQNTTSERRQTVLKNAGSIYGEKFFAGAIISLKEKLTEEVQQALSFGPFVKCGRLEDPTKAVLHQVIIPKEVKMIFRGIHVDAPFDLSLSLEFEADIFAAVREDPPLPADLLTNCKLTVSGRVHRDVINVLKKEGGSDGSDSDSDDDEDIIRKLLPDFLKGPKSMFWGLEGSLGLFQSTSLHFHFGDIAEMMSTVSQHVKVPEEKDSEQGDSDEDGSSNSGGSNGTPEALTMLFKQMAMHKKLRKMGLKEGAKLLFDCNSDLWRKGPKMVVPFYYAYNLARKFLKTADYAVAINPIAIATLETSIPLGDVGMPSLEELMEIAKDSGCELHEDVEKAMAMIDTHGADLLAQLKDKAEAKLF